MKSAPFSGTTLLAIVGACVLSGAPAPRTAVGAVLPPSIAQFAGNANFTAGGDIEFMTLAAPPPGSDASIRITPAGNTLSWAGYNVPNPAGQFPPVYQAGIRNIIGGVPPAGDFLKLPAVVIDVAEVGPAIGGSRFVLNTWSYRIDVVGGVSFFNGVGRGLLYENGGSGVEGIFAVTAPFLDQTLGMGNAFAAALTIVPVPGAIWLLGSGLLVLATVRPRR